MAPCESLMVWYRLQNMTQDWNLASEYFTVLSNSIRHHHRARFRTKEYSGHLPRSGGVTLAWRSSEKHLVPAMRRTRTWSPGRYVTTLALLQSTWWTENICKYCSELPSKAIGSLIYSIQGGTVAFSELQSPWLPSMAFFMFSKWL